MTCGLGVVPVELGRGYPKPGGLRSSRSRASDPGCRLTIRRPALATSASPEMGRPPRAVARDLLAMRKSRSPRRLGEIAFEPVRRCSHRTGPVNGSPPAWTSPFAASSSASWLAHCHQRSDTGRLEQAERDFQQRKRRVAARDYQSWPRRASGHIGRVGRLDVEPDPSARPQAGTNPDLVGGGARQRYRPRKNPLPGPATPGHPLGRRAKGRASTGAPV